MTPLEPRVDYRCTCGLTWRETTDVGPSRPCPQCGGVGVREAPRAVVEATDEQREAFAVYCRARRELGPDLDGGSVVDLLCDNMPVSLERARSLAAWIDDTVFSIAAGR